MNKSAKHLSQHVAKAAGVSLIAGGLLLGAPAAIGSADDGGGPIEKAVVAGSQTVQQAVVAGSQTYQQAVVAGSQTVQQAGTATSSTVSGLLKGLFSFGKK